MTKENRDMVEGNARNDDQVIVPGMKVEATEGDLGEEDVSPAKVTDVEMNQQGDVEAIKVSKGVLFKKELEVPADRIQKVNSADPDDKSNGTITIDAKEEELESLTKPGQQTLPPEPERSQDDLLDVVEQQAPTTEGMREMERDVHAPRPRSSFLRVIGPGLLSGTSGNDPSAVTTYAINGANAGYGQLWLMLLTTPLYYAVQFACAKIGRISQRGLSQLMREHYGRPVAIVASLLLVISNVALIAADLAAVGSGFELITGITWVWFVVPVALVLWYLTVYRNFESFKKIFLTMSFVFIAYILTSFFTHANWGTVLVRTFVPQLGFNFTSISSAVAILGATISPYSMFWQAQAEIEEKREGPLKQQLGTVKLDVGSGAVAGQLVAYFIIITTASTLFVHHANINTAADAARSLEPLAGPLARYLFAIGLIGSGLVAIPVLLASTSYAVSGAVGWPGALAKRPWQSEGFYLVLTAATVVAMVITLLRVDPIKLIFWSNIVAAIVAPLLVIAILLVGNHRTIMKNQRLSLLNNFGLVLIVLILIVGAVLLFYGLASGQGG
ncbi:MAG: divalent metal cation transporter [Chloroflexi bacterium]|nr:MAG: divalent metal cation transporter [Chloroflexota bacterium]